NLSLFTTKAIIILDTEGKKIVSKYYDNKVVKDQKVFEKQLYDKTKRQNSEIIMFDGHVVVYKNSIDVNFYLIGSSEENELILSAILQTFFDALSILLKTQVEKRSIMDNMDLIFLALDETISDGILLESDPSIIASRVSKRPEDGLQSGTYSNIPLSEQTISQAIQTAKEQIAKSLLK
ncbi:Coatomer subunit zeta-1, partial [Clydaea vesicula]